MTIIIAWRNIWRNTKRSGIIILSISFGIWAGVFTMGLSLGMVDPMIEDALQTYISHIQIHSPGFRQSRDIKTVIPDGNTLTATISQLPGVESMSARIVLAGMASSPTSANGIQIIGVNPSREISVTDISKRLVEGIYFDSSRHNQVVIGAKLASHLKVRLGSKIVLTSAMPTGEIAAGAFRVSGIYRTTSSAYDESTVFINIDEADKLFGLSGEIHQIAILTNSIDEIDRLLEILKTGYPHLEISGWKDISPELAMLTSMMDQSLLTILIIILFALVFGITNTMLMGVLERTRELGVLMALGLKNRHIFGMIMLETILLSIVGGIFGTVLGMATNAIFARTGIDLSLFGEALSSFGMSTVIYPLLYPRHYVMVISLVILTAIIASIYPGIRAIHLKPVQAIRTY